MQKKTKGITVVTAFLLFTFSAINAQSWTDYSEIQSLEEFQEAQEDFERYWSDKTDRKSKGYKPFKRWEYKWQERIQNEGKIPNAGAHLLEYQRFLKSYSSSTSRDANSPWESLGPNSTTGGYAGTGRIMSVGFDPNDNNIIYTGSAGGGLWKSTDGGASWTAKTDFLGSIGISAILVDPNTPSTIYIGTGDGDASDNYSIGVLKSTDSGETWNTTGLTWSTSSTNLIRNMVMDPNDVNTILLASNIGIYRTTDAGVTWNQVQSGNFFDVEMNPSGPSNTFYAATIDEIFKSTNNGASWTLKYTVANANRLSIATTADNSNYLYVLSSGSSSGANGSSGFNGVFRSSDAGETFTSMSTSPNLLGYAADGSGSGGQGWYDLVLAADPNAANTIHVGGVNHWKSNDGGATWTIKSHWSGSGGIFEVHADKHLMEFQDDNTLWEGNDGGIYRTTNGGDTWTDRTSNMVISQMYRIGVAEVDQQVIAGLQDNGTKKRANNTTWTDVLGGDGMDCAISPINPSILYGESQRGNISRSNDGGNNWTFIAGSFPDGAWVTPIAVDNEDEDAVYTAFDRVYKSTNQGSAWTEISAPFGAGNMTKLEVSNLDPNYIYTGISSALWATEDGGTTWEQRNTPGSYSMVKISKTNAKTLYATRANYSNGQKVYKSTDGGRTWTNISGNLPNIPANCIAIHDDGEETIYVGMDVGVYFKNASTPDWTLMNTDLPNVQIREIEIKESSNEIYLATYGRGVWKNGTIGSESTCKAPLDLTIAIDAADSGTATWDAPTNAPANGYQYAFNQSFEAPSSGIATTDLNVPLSNIEQGNDYYFHVRSMCGASNSSWISYGPIKAKVTCGSTTYDSGGSGADYGDNENTTLQICPTPGQTDLTITFNTFSTEVGYDALYIHNGPDTNSPLFPGGATAMSNSFPVGGFVGTTIPGPFTSTDASGCITLNFRSDGSVTRFGWDVDVSCSVDNSCQEPVNLTVTDIGATVATANWEAPFSAPTNGYEYAVTENQNPPTNGSATTDLGAAISDLTPETTYYLHAVSVCTGDKSDWVTSAAFTTKLGCGSSVYDIGGANGDYGNNQDITTTICPDPGQSSLTITLDAIGIEANYDALYIHNGPDTDSPLFPGGVTSMSNSFPVGGFNGTTVPGPFTSTDPSGCITLRMLSDFSVVGIGYSGVLSCNDQCNAVVSNHEGAGSLRAAIGCVEAGGSITIDPSLAGQVIQISQPLIVDKAINIIPNAANSISIQTDLAGPVIDITANGNLQLDNISINSGTGSTAAGIRNAGTLELINVTVKKNFDTLNPTSVLENTGTIKITGDTSIEEE